MADSIRLTDAIKANENGLKSLVAQRDRHRAIIEKESEKRDALTHEINARIAMTTAMKNLQAVYPDNETIRFTIP